MTRKIAAVAVAALAQIAYAQGLYAQASPGSSETAPHAVNVKAAEMKWGP